MAGIDKAAIGWTIAIVIAGVGIAVIGPGLESGSSITAPAISDDKIAAAKETISQEQQEMIKPDVMKETEVMVEDTMTEDTMESEDTMTEDTMESEDTMTEDTMESEDTMTEDTMESEDTMTEDTMESEDTMTEDTMESEDTMTEDTMESEDTMKTEDAQDTHQESTLEPQTHTVSMPEGSSNLDCETDNTCYIPADITINVGDTIVWVNDDSPLLHTVTSGDLKQDANLVGTDYPDGFDSQIMAAGATFEHTFDTAGTYPYFCTLHPWMKGIVQVN